MLLGVPLEIGINRLAHIERDGFHILQDILIMASVKMVGRVLRSVRMGKKIGEHWR